jgi:hypothetical protein
MSDTGLTVPGMTERPRRYDVTVIVDRDGGHLPDPAVFTVTAKQAAPARAASITGAHTAGQITVQAADQPAAVAIALAVVSEALDVPVTSSRRDDNTSLEGFGYRVAEQCVCRSARSLIVRE